MTFKERIQQDLDTVFLNLDEFAELRRVEGKQIPVVVDNDQLVKLKQGQILGLVEATCCSWESRQIFRQTWNPAGS